MWTVLIVTAAISQTFAEELIVELPDGKVQGTTLNTPSGKKFYTWRHIPFAKPPIGELRFQPPVKPDPWDGILDGSKDSKGCHYVGTFAGDPVATHGYSEDCLYIGVYSPVEANSSLHLPVMFYIYGGKFIAGAADFAFTDPTPLLEENIIYVIANYRLSLFGFLSTDDQILPGNVGLKDQLAALEWTKENIAVFGGNPDDITIFGHSAGAVAVGYHLISPRSRNMFTKAIFQSGSSLFNILQADCRKNSINLASKVNSSINNLSSSEEILRVLQTASVDWLINITSENDIEFFPSLEPENDLAILTQPLYETLEAGQVSRIPIMIGITTAEQPNIKTVEGTAETGALFDSNLAALLPQNIHLRNNVNATAVAKQIKYVYVGCGSFEKNPAAVVNFQSDTNFTRSTIEYAILQSRYSPVYFYQFSFVGTLSEKNPDIPGAGKGVQHAQDLGYLFNISTKPIKTEADYLIRQRLVKLWTNFAKTKNPTPRDDSDDTLQNVTWTQFDEHSLAYLDIGDNLEIKYDLKRKITAFWDYLWSAYSSRPYNTF